MTMSSPNTWLLVVVLILAVGLCRAGDRPILLGVDNAGSDWIYRSDCEPASDEQLRKALDELGVNFFVYHLIPDGAGTPEAMARRVARIDDAMRSLGIRYTLNDESANWAKSLELEPGVNEFAHPDGTHRWDLRMDWLEQVLPPAKPGAPALIGITHDECEHMQLTSHQFATYPEPPALDAPRFADTDGKDMETAYNLIYASAKRIHERYYKGRVVNAAEQVWPDMFHIFARAGWVVAPKILKENLSSVVMAISLGAAIQYAEPDSQWWVSPDLWCGGYYPGHSPQALRSALLMGYWLGADALYVENLDFQVCELRHPEAPPKGSLLRWNDDGSYELTAYGKVVKDFYRRYVPAHPRKVSWRDYRPKVAIIRLPDGAWGQKGTMFRDRLLGNREHPMDDISAEWLHVWPILTHGVARDGAISLNNGTVYPVFPWPFFVPIDSVAVFDHLVTGKVLDSVECFVVCGHALSERTFRDVAARVGKGATCIIARRLYDQHASGKLPGKWIIVDSFTDPAVARGLKPFLGPSDVARFRFDGCTIEFRPTTDRDSVDVRVVPD